MRIIKVVKHLVLP